MEDTYFWTHLMTGFVALVCLSSILATFVLGEGFKFIKFLLVGFILFGSISWVTMNEWDTLRETRFEAEEKKAVYYKVSENTKSKIEAYCEDRHPKYSTQQTCIRTTVSALKYGDEHNGFKPSDVVVKPSGVPAD